MSAGRAGRRGAKTRRNPVWMLALILAALLVLAPTVAARPASAAGLASNATQLFVDGPIVSAAKNPAGAGYWVLTSNGSVYNLGGTTWYGSPMQQFHVPLGIPLVAIAATPSGHGYFVLCSNGSVFAYGDARWAGSPYQTFAGNSPAMVAMAVTPAGGYEVLGANGGVYDFGGASWYGSPRVSDGSGPVPMVGITTTSDGRGYVAIAANGDAYAFGDAKLPGSSGNALHVVMGPVGSILSVPGASGYWVLSSDGSVTSLGGAPSMGSLAGHATSAAVALVPAGGGGYRIVQSDATVYSYPTSAPPPAGVPAAAVSDPATNASPQYSYCSGDTPACDALALQGINLARAQEGLGVLKLPFGYEGFTPAEQILAVINAERTARALPAFVLDQAALGGYALTGAQNQVDPIGPQGMTWLSIMAARTTNPLVSDFLWMYSDGFGSSNLDCTSASAAGCWGHRHNILVPANGYSGTAQYADVETAIFQI